MIPRIFHKWYAKVMGYFWLPCPICADMFGGHERHGPGGVIIDKQQWCYCKKPTCYLSAQIQNKEAGYDTGPQIYEKPLTSPTA